MIATTERSNFASLIAALRPFIERRVQAADTDDVLQDVLLRMQRGLGGLRDDERFGPWVYRVARNAITDHRRRRARLPLSQDDAASEPAGEADDDDQAARRLAETLSSFVAELPSPYRETLTLTELEDIGQREAAEMLGVSLSAVKSRVQRGRQQLRRLLENCCHIALDARGKVQSCEPRDDGKVPAGCCAERSCD
jgi:RNA polymerase sigma-70 factor (ECF subfamily)